MDAAEEFYKRKFESVQRKMADKKISKEVDKHLAEISKLVDCGVEINFVVMPHVENYEELQQSDDYSVPELPSMKLRDLIDHLKKEDKNMDVYIDPIYLKKGVNQITDILITTSDENNGDTKLIIIPIAFKNTK